MLHVGFVEKDVAWKKTMTSTTSKTSFLLDDPSFDESDGLLSGKDLYKI